jgi:hypothetical protein
MVVLLFFDGLKSKTPARVVVQGKRFSRKGMANKAQ